MSWIRPTNITSIQSFSVKIFGMLVFKSPPIGGDLGEATFKNAEMNAAIPA